MRKTKKSKEKIDPFGNVTFGEVTELLVDIIGQIVILDFVPAEEQSNYKRRLERMYDGKGDYSDFSTAALDSPQDYFSRFFKEVLEVKYGISPLAMITIDSFTWQFFFALRQFTPLEKPKKEIAVFLIKKQIFNFIYDTLIGGITVDRKFLSFSPEAIIDFLTDSFDLFFSDLEVIYKNEDKSFINELRQYWEENCKGNTEDLKNLIIDELLNDEIFYNEIKEGYQTYNPDELKKQPKLLNLLRTGKENKYFNQIFKEAIEEFIENNIKELSAIIDEIPKNKIKYPHSHAYIDSGNSGKSGKFNLDDNIANWRKNDINPTWKTLKIILDFLCKNDKQLPACRLIGLYFLKNTQRAIETNLGISRENEQEKIIEEIIDMIKENKKPEEFYEEIYKENDAEYSHQANILFLCMAYQHLTYWNPANYNAEILMEIFKTMKNKYANSSKFFYPWLKARADVFEKGETLNDKEKEEIIDGYKNAYANGLAYAGEYLSQFLLEAITINNFFYPQKEKNTNDLFGYSYALEMFGDKKDELLQVVKNSGNLKQNIVSIYFSILGPIGKTIYDNYPPFRTIQSISEVNKEAGKLNEKGLKFEATGNLEYAKDCFSAALLLNPVYIDAYYNRGYLYNEMGGEYTENALNDFNMTLLLEPDHENTLYNRGLLLMLKKGQFGNAINDFTRIININHNDSDAYMKRGTCFKQLKCFALAIKDYNKSIELKPSTEAYFNRGNIYALSGYKDKAQADFKKILEIDPYFFRNSRY